MNEFTAQVIKENIKVNCADLQELMQDYLAHNEEVGYHYYLLMLALDELAGNEDPTLAYHQLFAEDYPDKDLDMVNKEAVLHNRKAIESYTKFNNERGWQ